MAGKQIDIAAKIRRAGTPVKGQGRSSGAVYEVCCTECGGKIRSDDIADVEYVETRRGSQLFFHSRCRKRRK